MAATWGRTPGKRLAVKWFFVIGDLAFALTSLILGIRLLILARRTRQVPELLLGIGFVSGGFLGHLLASIVYMVKPPEPYLTFFVYLLRTGAALACVMVAALPWYVFRRDRGDLWARVLLGSITAILVTYVFRDYVLPPAPHAIQMRSPVYWLHVFGMTAPYLWCLIESFRYQSLLWRQWSIGLPADLAVATRMKFWAIGMGAIGAMFLGMELIRAANSLFGAGWNPRIPVSSMGLLCAISLWIAFFPPRAYMSRIEAQAAAPPAA